MLRSPYMTTLPADRGRTGAGAAGPATTVNATPTSRADRIASRLAEKYPQQQELSRGQRRGRRAARREARSAATQGSSLAAGADAAPVPEEIV